MAGTYKILLVDDEEEVRTSIINKVDWEATGFQVVGDAENGQDALEKFELLEPDLVLTDIRMPYMDGLTLASQLRKIRPSIKIVIFSGFDDFEYAKQAISLNIMEYILKPVNAQELKEILVKIKNALDDEIAQLKDINMLRDSFFKNLPILRENFLNDLIRNRVEESLIESKMKEYNLSLGECGCWNVIQVSLDSDNKTEDPQSLKTLSAKKLIDNHLSKGFCFESFYMAQGVAAIIGLESGRKLTELINILNDVSREGRKILDQRLTIGIGQVVSSITDLETSYRGAQTALGYKAMAGVGDVIFIADMEIEKEESLVLDGKMEGKLISALKFGEEETVALCAREIADKMRQARVHESQCQVYIISILNVVLKIMQRYELNNEEIFGEMADYYEILISISDADSLEKWICKTGKAIVENITDEREDSTKNMIRMAKKYINDNYSNSEISLETICSHLHMSVTYFSTIFKREVGESYTAYLTRTRLEKAAELLSTTDEKTYMIAKQVGYEEPNYFGYVFKRMYGVSPNKFRGK